MVDVTLVPPGAFGYVPTPALVAPLEFTMREVDYAALGGHMDAIVPMDEVLARPGPSAGRAATADERPAVAGDDARGRGRACICSTARST